MKTYKHNRLNWTAKQREDGNYNLYKGDSLGYTIRFKDEIEGSRDWLTIRDISTLGKEANEQLEALRKKLEEGEKSGFVDGDLWEKGECWDKPWEEVTPPKDYEVLEYIWNDDKYVKTSVDYKCDILGKSALDMGAPAPVGWRNDIPPSDFKNRTITKVKRSDGAVLSVGDYVRLPREYNPHQKISYFKMGQSGALYARVEASIKNWNITELNYLDNSPQEQTTEELLADMENQRDSAWDTLHKIESILEQWKEKK